MSVYAHCWVQAAQPRFHGRYHTRISTKYNRSWITDIRELIQNAFDGIRPLQTGALRSTVTPTDQPVVTTEVRDDTNRQLLQIQLSDNNIRMEQRMHPDKPQLHQHALLFHSEKCAEAGDIGGFGEGLKICALQLLMSGHALVYEMFQEQWTFLLEPFSESAQELVVDIAPRPDRTTTDLVISISGPSCRVIFNPNSYLQLVPRPVVYRAGPCAFLDVGCELPKRVLFVNDVFLKETDEISLDVNMSLPLNMLSPDRDTLRVEASEVIKAALMHKLPHCEDCQRLCFTTIEKFGGKPQNDFRRLPSEYRLMMLGSWRKTLGRPKAMPIRKDADRGTRHLYTLLDLDPVELTSADYFLEGVDFENQLAKLLATQPVVSPPPDAQGDVGLLQHAVLFVTDVFTRYGYAGAAFTVDFVSFRVLLTEPVRCGNRVFFHADLYHTEVCWEQLRAPRLSAWLTMLMGEVLSLSQQVHRKVLSHIQRQLLRLLVDPSAVLDVEIKSVLAHVAVPTEDSKTQPAIAPPSPHTAPTPTPTATPTAAPTTPPSAAALSRDDYAGLVVSSSASEVAATALRATRERWGGGAPETVGQRDGGGGGVDPEPDVDDRVPPLSQRSLCDGGEQVVVYMQPGASPPKDLVQNTKHLRRVAAGLVANVFPELRGILSLCYFPSQVRGFHDPQTGGVLINLYHTANLSTARDVFTLLCHELAHVGGELGHGRRFAESMAAIVLDHTSAYLATTHKLQ